MVKRIKEYAVVYDISDDKERGKVEKTIKKYGFRIQKSVFECKLDKSLKTKLVNELRSLNIRTGFVKIYELTDLLNSEIYGKEVKTIDDKEVYIF